MWQLKSEKESQVTSQTYRIIVDEEIIVGRKSCDIIITDDQSVSRKHATLRASYPISNVADLKFKPVLTVKDSSSKYGTFVNGKLIDSHGTILKHGDLVTFGQCGSNFRASYTPLVVTTSCMEPNEKSALKEVVRKLGGHVVDEWNTECTHLAMSKVKVTVKTGCALVSKRPIVLMDYFNMLLECYKNGKEPEDPEKFLPPVNEILISDNTNFHVDPKREQLFKDKTFVFLSVQQYKKLRLLITLAGGKTVLMNRSRCDVTPELLLSSCVIQSPVNKENSNTQASSQSQTCSTKEVEDIADLLQRNKRRQIPESDIGLAIVHCSTEQYCNPEYEMDKSQSSNISNDHYKLQSQTLSQNFVYVSETLFSTQTSTDKSPKKTDCVKDIPSSLPSSVDKMSEPSSSTKLSATETVEGLNLNLPKTERSSKTVDLGKPSTSLCLDGAGENSANSMRSEISSLRNKRSAERESEKEPRNAKREKIDSLETIATCDVKIEPRSPPLQEAVHGSMENDYESIFDADTQPTSQTLFKDESQDIEIKPNAKPAENNSDALPIKRQRKDSDVEQNKKCKLSINSTESNISNKKNGDISLPLGYLNSKLLNKNSPVVSETPDAAEDILCRSLRIVKLADLVVNRVAKQANENKENVNSGSPVKNFKKFRKSCYAGAKRMPTIIGGCDLIVHSCKENLSELNEFLQNQESENTQPNAVAMGNTSFKINFTRQSRLK